MTTSHDRRLQPSAIGIAVGTVFFFFALLLFFYRRAGPTNPSKAVFWFFAAVGVCTAVVGGVEANGHPPGQRGLGTALVAEGIILIVLTAIAWSVGLPAPLAPL